ncbi:MAG: hypothetical protein OEY56_13990, partial [Cyclobacteriaceae bacterium]|nr:hypothetical protein [Cyclobacteriaceae bacterium]
LSFHAFYLDPFYMKWAGKGYARVSAWVTAMDEKIIDPLLNRLGIGFVVFSKLMDLADKLLVDGLVNLLARVAYWTGDFIRLFHSSRVQVQFIWGMIGLILILLGFHLFSYE